MKRFIIGFTALFLALTLDVDVPAEERPPNVVFVLTDDLGYSDIECYGAKKVKTPHIDRLTAGGSTHILLPLFTTIGSASGFFKNGVTSLPLRGREHDEILRYWP